MEVIKCWCYLCCKNEQIVLFSFSLHSSIITISLKAFHNGDHWRNNLRVLNRRFGNETIGKVITFHFDMYFLLFLFLLFAKSFYSKLIENRSEFLILPSSARSGRTLIWMVNLWLCSKKAFLTLQDWIAKILLSVHFSPWIFFYYLFRFLPRKIIFSN